MSYINCPECKKVISDKVQFCPGCGFPVGEFTDPSLSDEQEDGISYAVLPGADDEIKNVIVPSSEMYRIPGRNEDDDLQAPQVNRLPSAEKYDSVFRKSEAPMRKKRRVYAAAAALVLSAAVCTGVIVSLSMSAAEKTAADGSIASAADDQPEEEIPVDGSDTCITGTEVKYNERFLDLASSETRPFVVVVKDNEFRKEIGVPYYYYILMQGGSASQLIETEFLEKKINVEEKFSVAGKLDGYEIAVENIEKPKINTKFTDDYESFHTTAEITTEITMNENVSGLLFYELPVEESRRGVTGGYTIIHKGMGKAYDAVYDLQYGTRKISTEFIPRYFVPCEELDEGDYRFTENPEVKVDDTPGDMDEITISGAVSLNEKVDGTLIYHYEIVPNPILSSVKMIKGLRPSFLEDGENSFAFLLKNDKLGQEYDPKTQFGIIGLVRIMPFGDDNNG